jgi:uncharacterized protein YndB with AHSA1/START domain
MTTRDVPYRVDIELEVPGTPEQVWQAIATEQGLAAWMMPADFEAREGAELAFHMGPDVSSHGRVTEVETGRRIVYEEDWATLAGHEGADVAPLATEFVVEARSGGTCVVRVVTSSFGTGADWEQEFFGQMTEGWDSMLDNLRLYLTRFPGRRATTPMWVSTEHPVAPEDAIAELTRELGISSVGDHVEVHGITAVVERSLSQHFLLRTLAPVEGFISFYAYEGEEACGVIVQGYLYSPDAGEYIERQLPSWQAWLDGLAARMGTTGAGRSA